MKTLKLFTIAIAFLGTEALNAGVPKEVLIPVSDIYTPKGFDSNDNTEIIITGYLPNLCHKAPKVKTKIQGDKIQVTLTSLKYDASNPYCPEVVVPFMKTIDLGVMQKGFYHIIANEGSTFEKEETIQIEKAQDDDIDENIYPLVNYIERVEGTRKIMIKGYNPSDCLELHEIEVISDQENTYAILPKMLQVNEFCPRKMTPFEYEIILPDTIDKDTVLLHIRSMNGNSVNKLYNNIF